MNRRHFSALALSPLLAGLWHAPSAAKPALPTVLVVGDSLSAEYGLKRGSGWVALMEQRLHAERPGSRVVNASISGDTTSGGRARLAALLHNHRPSLVIIELGGNDALRGLPLSMTQDNLLAMVQSAQTAGAKVLLLGMQVPPNYGQQYAAQFAATYVSTAKTSRAALVPFLLKNVADGPDALKLFQADRIHPAEAAHPLILDNVWPAVKRLIA